MDCSPPGSSIHGISQARVLEWVSIFFLQGIFPTQGSNLCLLLWQAESLPLSHLGSWTLWICYLLWQRLHFPGSASGKESPASAGDTGLIPELGRSPAEGDSKPLQSILAWTISWTEEPVTVEAGNHKPTGTGSNQSSMCTQNLEGSIPAHSQLTPNI